MNQQQKPPPRPPRPPLVGIHTKHDAHGIDCNYPKAETARDGNSEIWIRTIHHTQLSGIITLEVHDGRQRQPARRHQVIASWPSDNYHEHACIPLGEIDVPDFDRLANDIKTLSNSDLHSFREFHLYLAKHGVKHVGGDSYTLAVHGTNKDLTPADVSSLEKKIKKAISEFLQDVFDGKIELRKNHRFLYQLRSQELHIVSNET